ncbi:carbohydrate kinase [Modestobacter lapidis]|nr:carbohydrate kinase [Modestobacter lapidis]
MGAAGGSVVVVGQVGRDLVLQVDRLPDAGGSAPVRGRREVLGGKGANQAVALVQLGRPAALLGVVGADAAGDQVLAEAVADGLDVSGVARRPGVATALLLDLVETGGVRRLLEDVPDAALLTAADVAAAAPLLDRAPAVLLQLQQPGDAVRAALAHAPGGALLVADGAAAEPGTRAAVLAAVDVLRADASEARAWVDGDLAGLDDVRAAARELCGRGPRVVSLAAGEDGDLTVWAGPDGGLEEQLVPLLGAEPVDPTGAGDTIVAALTAALLRGAGPRTAAWEAGAAAALTVARAGGRPRLDPVGVTRDAVAAQRGTEPEGRPATVGLRTQRTGDLA